MKHRLLTLALLFPLVGQALDLTPRGGTRELEGMRIRVLYFNDGDKTIRYQPPGNWDLSGGGDELVYTPRKVNDAEIRWRIIHRKPEQAAVPEPPEILAKWAQTLVPSNVDEVKLVETRQSPFTLNGRGSWEFLFTYLIGGRRFDKSISVCDVHPTERLVVIVSAYRTDFTAVRDAAISSLFSWQ